MATASMMIPSASERSSRPPASWRSPRSKPGDLIWRSLAARVRNLQHARLDPNRDPLKEFVGSDEYELLDVVTKAATTVGRTDTAGWAAEVLAVTTQQFVQTLQSSFFGGLAQVTTGFTLGQGSVPKFPTRTASPTIAGAFCGEAQPAPVRRAGFTSLTLQAKKVVVISEYSSELAKAAQPNLEATLRALITNDTQAVVDAALTDASAADTVRPPGLRSFGAGITASAASSALDKLIADLKALVNALLPASRIGLLVHPLQAVSLTALLSTDPEGLPTAGIRIFSSPHITAGTVIAVDLDAFLWAAAPPVFDVSENATLHEEDTTPLPIQPGTITTIADVTRPIRSVFQTQCIALRMVWLVNWGLARSGAVAWIGSVGWV